MSFLFPCDDIMDEIDQNHETLSINKSLVIIGYQESQWTNDAPIKQLKFDSFQDLLSNNDNITLDNIVYIEYIDIFLWHKHNNIDRINGSGSTQKSEQWCNIQHLFTSHLRTKSTTIGNDDDEKSPQKQYQVTLGVDRRPAPLLGQKQVNHYRRRYRYYWNQNRATDIINDGFYEVTNANGGKPIKIKIEKALKKSYKKSKLYREDNEFKYLSATQIDMVYRNYENMEMNLLNDTPLNAIYRLHAAGDKTFKKLCVLNVYGESNGLERNSTLYHSLTRYDYDISKNTSDEASPYLYSNTMVYSPSCVLFNDLNGDLTASYLKVSILTVYPVNCTEYYRIKRKKFDEPVVEDRLKALDDKLNNLSKKHRKQKHKKVKRSEEETIEFVAKLNEMKETIEAMMRDRIRRMIEIAIYNGCDAVVFTAFGCNAHFGNDAHQIATIFAEFIKTVYYNCFKSVTFAVCDEDANVNHKRHNVKLDKENVSKFRMFE
eukprot:23113_1